ncbi:hypothetical protein LOZ80_17500 [Paenibacillus sp. HWE-109]|uniref:hypothetical protein n=1 Tax=Paenibacillus sp. HWE-109 TaxID=1306526 RepID=UPI001EDDB0CA|nr:hypothetical protein [Paenibacillus sp. HWE-109]UKS30634.1 hypothetical protein LOZ80_17500 [Paenibacillus sp. HWE-109]
MNAEGNTPLRSNRSSKEMPVDETYLPPRKAVHPSEQGKWTSIFYLSLLWIFIILVVGLTFWGIKYYS